MGLFVTFAVHYCCKTALIPHMKKKSSNNFSKFSGKKKQCRYQRTVQKRKKGMEERKRRIF